MKKLKISIFVLALALTAGASYAAKTANSFDCSAEPGGPATLNSSNCSGSGAVCCYLISNGDEIQKAP